MKDETNFGKVPLRLGVGRWKMSKEEPEPTGIEFEEFSERLDAFLDGFFYARKIFDSPAYVRGDFLYERTEAIYFEKESDLASELASALAKWISTGRDENWRILIFPKDGSKDVLVIYSGQII